MIKLIATDIDGTLLETGKTMPDPRKFDEKKYIYRMNKVVKIL